MTDRHPPFEQIPTSRPETPLLDTINFPDALRLLEPADLQQLAWELRHFLLFTVGKTGGHFGAGLGVVELTVALHYVFATPEDQLIWDVGHQTYPHKILTGRRESMQLLRKPGGIAPFPSREESVFDAFGTGHSSTSLSAALGMALAGQLTGNQHHTVVVIGDGAMTAGQAFEALNHIAACQADVLVILNDNAMSISENVGGLANYFARNSADTQAQITTSPGSIFTDLGFDYHGPIDGHHLPALLKALREIKEQPGPRLLHVMTKKGKGYAPAEAAPVDSHSLTKLEKQTLQNAAPGFSGIFGDWILNKAAGDNRLVAITPAMKEGSGLAVFAERYPSRFHDVAIAEQHAMTFAAGLAAGGAKPVLAIYSTFLQRAYDQLIHDIALQNLDVLIAVDRASLLEDGPTHSGIFDYAFARTVPNLTILAPSTDWSMTAMLNFAYQQPGPCLVRYPRGTAVIGEPEAEITLGCGVTLRQGERVALLCFGAVRAQLVELANTRDYTLIDMRFIKPIDEALICELAASHQLLVTVEEHAIAGGAGSATGEVLARHCIGIDLLNLGIPDRFIEQDEPTLMQADAGISLEAIDAAISHRLAVLRDA